ncbi:CBS domain-containing protein [bacterium]|nr:CBS domain-containing protein [bacterium]
MEFKQVKELAVSLDEYALVNENTTLVEALKKMAESSKSTLISHGHQARAVLVSNQDGEVIGVLGHMDFLRALEPKYNMLGDLEVLSRAKIDTEILDSMSELLGFWKGSLDNLCRRAAVIEVKYLMHPIKESINEDAPITEAIHKMIIWQAMRILVTRNEKEVVGVLRLADLFTDVAERMRKKYKGNTEDE